MSSFVEQVRSASKQPVSKNNEVKHNEKTIIIMDRLKFVTDKYYDDILEGIKKAASKGYTKYFINLQGEDFVIPDIDYEPNKLKRRWLSILSTEKSELVPHDKPSLNGFRFTVWNNQKNTVVFEW